MLLVSLHILYCALRAICSSLPDISSTVYHIRRHSIQVRRRVLITTCLVSVMEIFVSGYTLWFSSCYTITSPILFYVVSPSFLLLQSSSSGCYTGCCRLETIASCIPSYAPWLMRLRTLYTVIRTYVHHTLNLYAHTLVLS